MPRFLTTNEAAERLRMRPQTLRAWRLRGGVGPRYTKPSRSRCLYSEEEIDKFLEARAYESTAEETVRNERGAA